MPEASPLQALETNAQQASSQLTHIATVLGKDSQEYRAALQRFATAWHTLRQVRDPEEFLPNH